jgi:hypothetical protein
LNVPRRAIEAAPIVTPPRHSEGRVCRSRVALTTEPLPVGIDEHGGPILTRTRVSEGERPTAFRHVAGARARQRDPRVEFGSSTKTSRGQASDLAVHDRSATILPRRHRHPAL